MEIFIISVIKLQLSKSQSKLDSDLWILELRISTREKYYSPLLQLYSKIHYIFFNPFNPEIHQSKSYLSSPNCFVSTHSALVILHQSSAISYNTYSYGNHPYPFSPQAVLHEFLIRKAPVVIIFLLPGF